MKAVLLAALVATGTTSRPVTHYERELALELSRQVVRAEIAEADLVAETQTHDLRVAALIQERDRERAARKTCEEAPAEVPGWVMPVVSVAVGVLAAGAGVLAWELSK